MPVNHIWGIRSENGENNQYGSSAEVYGHPKISNSRIVTGQIFGDAHIERSVISGYLVVAGGPTIMDSTLTGYCRVMDSALVSHSSVSDNAVICDNSQVYRSEIMGSARIKESAVVENAIVGGEAIVKGTARIEGPTGGYVLIDGYSFLDRGVWNRAPIHYVTKSGLVVCESADDLININCITNSLNKILSEAGTRYGKMLGMTQEEIDEVKHYAELIAKEKGICY